MTRRDFTLIATIIDSAYQDHPDREAGEAIDQIAYDFAARLKATNPLFDSDRFLAACGTTITTGS